jgi:hypothetical protein
MNMIWLGIVCGGIKRFMSYLAAKVRPPGLPLIVGLEGYRSLSTFIGVVAGGGHFVA